MTTPPSAVEGGSERAAAENDVGRAESASPASTESVASPDVNAEAEMPAELEIEVASAQSDGAAAAARSTPSLDGADLASTSPELGVASPEVIAEPALSSSGDEAVPESTTADDEGKQRKKKKFEPQAWHWWLSIILGPLVALAAVFVNHNDSERATAATRLPSANGSPGQPDAPLANACSDSSDNIAGWGPDRPMVGKTTFLPWPGFNSDRFGPALGGDERNMVGGRETNSDQNWSNDVRVEHGKTYTLRIYIHNSAADTDETIATGTRVRMPLPSCKSKRIAINGFVYSPDAFPIQVWGGVNLVADSPFRVSYVADSARLEGNFTPHGDGDRIPGTAFLGDQGQLVGQPSLDGNLRGGWKNSMYFSMLVRVSME